MAPPATSYYSNDPAASPATEASASTPTEKPRTHVMFLDMPTSSFCWLLFGSHLVLRDHEGLMKSIKESARSTPKYTGTGLTAALAVVAGISMRRFGIYRGAEWEEDVLSCAPYAAFIGVASSRRVAARTALHFLGFGFTVFAADVAFKYYPTLYPQAKPPNNNDGLSSGPDN